MDLQYFQLQMDLQYFQLEATIRQYLKTHSIKATYNHFTKNCVEMACDENNFLKIYLEVHFNNEELYLSLWYEPDDFSQRCRMKELIIRK